MNLFRRSKRNRRIIAVVSDIHSGYRLGLCDPNVVLLKEDDEGDICEWTPELTTTQHRLWDAYLDNLASLERFADGDEILALHTGDATHGDRYNATIPETTREDQRAIAIANLLPLANLPTVQKMRLVTGTEVHVPESAEARIAYRLGQEATKDIRCLHHARFSVDGRIADVAHHGPPPGSRDWLRGNVALYYLRDRVYVDRRNGVRPADVYLRGHFHDYVPVPMHDEWEGERRLFWLVVVPSFSGLTHYARKVTRSVPTASGSSTMSA